MHQAPPAGRSLSRGTEANQGSVTSATESRSATPGGVQRGQDEWQDRIGPEIPSSNRHPEPAADVGATWSGRWLADVETHASVEDVSCAPDLILREYLRMAHEDAAPATPMSCTSGATAGASGSMGSRPGTPKSLSTPNSAPAGQNAMWGAGPGWWASNEYPALGGGSMPSTPDSVDSRGSGVKGGGAWGASVTKRGGGASTPGTCAGNRDSRGSSSGGGGAAGAGGEDCSLDKYDLDRFEENHTVFEEHLSYDEAQRLVKTRVLYCGTLQVDASSLRATVCVDVAGM